VLIANEQAMSENNDGWVDMYRQGYKTQQGDKHGCTFWVALMKQSMRAIPNIFFIVCAWQMDDVWTSQQLKETNPLFNNHN